MANTPGASYKNESSARAARWNKENPKRAKANHDRYRQSEKGQVNVRNSRLKKYNITLDKYNIMLDAQNNVCAICKKEEKIKSNIGKIKKLSVDHCHKTGKVRAILCDTCNGILGKANDDIALLKETIKYLEKHLGT